MDTTRAWPDGGHTLAAGPPPPPPNDAVAAKYHNLDADDDADTAAAAAETTALPSCGCAAALATRCRAPPRPPVRPRAQRGFARLSPSASPHPPATPHPTALLGGRLPPTSPCPAPPTVTPAARKPLWRKGSRARAANGLKVRKGPMNDAGEGETER